MLILVGYIHYKLYWSKNEYSQFSHFKNKFTLQQFFFFPIWLPDIGWYFWYQYFDFEQDRNSVMYFASSTGWMVDTKNKFRRIHMRVDQPNLATIDLSLPITRPQVSETWAGWHEHHVQARIPAQWLGNKVADTPFFFF